MYIKEDPYMQVIYNIKNQTTTTCICMSYNIQQNNKHWTQPTSMRPCLQCGGGTSKTHQQHKTSKLTLHCYSTTTPLKTDLNQHFYLKCKEN